MSVERFLADHGLTTGDLPSCADLGWEHMETWTCTDCGAAIPRDEVHEHMQHEHGVSYGLDRLCPSCTETEPCARARAIVGRD